MKTQYKIITITILAAVLMFTTCSKDDSLSSSGPKAPYPTAALRINGDTGAIHQRPAVAFNNAGRGIAVWVEQAEWNARMLYAVYNDGWAAESVLLSSVSKDAHPAIASDGTGFMLIYSSDSAYAIPFDASGAPGETHSFSGSYPVTQEKPSVISAGPGKYAATWRQYDSPYRVYATCYSDMDGLWSKPVPVSSATGDVSSWYPLSMASNGMNYAVTWQQNDAGESNIYANISSGGTWTATTTALLEADPGLAYNPRIASNGTDFAVAWQQQDVSEIYHVYASVSSSGSWTAAIPVEAGTGHSIAPDIASKGADFAVTWQQDDYGVYSIYANISSSGTWSTAAAALLESSGDSSYGPRIVSNGPGTAVTWLQWDAEAGRYKLCANVFSALTSATKDNALSIENNTGSVLLMRIIPKETGYAVVWQQNKSSAWNSIYANIYGSSWGQPAELVKGMYRNTSSQPVIATNKNGVTLAVWMQYELNVRQIFGRIHSSGAWGTPFRISGANSSSVDAASNGADFMIVYTEESVLKARTCAADGTLGAAYPLGGDPENSYYADAGRIVSNGTGYGAAWTLSRAMAGSVYARIYHQDTGWGTAALLEEAAGSASNPVIASDTAGYAVAWEQIDAGQTFIFANEFDGSAWSGATLIGGGDRAGRPKIASNGETYAVAWHEINGTAYSLYANVFSSLTASTRDSARPVENESVSLTDPAIASNGTNYAVTWSEYDTADHRTKTYVNMFSSLTDATKDGAVCIDNDGKGSVAAIASDRAGYAMLCIQYEEVYNKHNIYANVFDGSVWTGPVVIESGSGRTSGGFITSNGNTYSAIWAQQDTADLFVYDIWAGLGF